VDCHRTLADIRDRLAAGEPPPAVIDSLVPRTLPEAEAWGRRLPLWAEFAPEYGERAVAVARLVSKRGLRLHRRTLDPEGHVIPGRPHDLSKPSPGQPVRFTLDVDGVSVGVVYTPRYARDQDHFQFRGPGDPPQPFALTPTGHYSHFAPVDAVIALGGPQGYARAFAAAGPDRTALFRRVFEGDFPEVPKPVRGKHTARAVRPSTPPLSEPAPEPPPAESPTPPPPKPRKPGGTPSLF
jgi:hypothetical protein